VSILLALSKDAVENQRQRPEPQRPQQERRHLPRTRRRSCALLPTESPRGKIALTVQPLPVRVVPNSAVPSLAASLHAAPPAMPPSDRTPASPQAISLPAPTETSPTVPSAHTPSQPPALATKQAISLSVKADAQAATRNVRAATPSALRSAKMDSEKLPSATPARPAASDLPNSTSPSSSSPASTVTSAATRPKALPSAMIPAPRSHSANASLSPVRAHIPGLPVIVPTPKSHPALAVIASFPRVPASPPAPLHAETSSLAPKTSIPVLVAISSLVPPEISNHAPAKAVPARAPAVSVEAPAQTVHAPRPEASAANLPAALASEPNAPALVRHALAAADRVVHRVHLAQGGLPRLLVAVPMLRNNKE